jgi:hypothetical protein
MTGLVKDGIHQTRRSLPSQIHDRTDFSNGISEGMRLLLPWLFTDKCLIELTPARELVSRLPATSIADGIYPRGFDIPGEDNGVRWKWPQLQDTFDAYGRQKE